MIGNKKMTNPFKKGDLVRVREEKKRNRGNRQELRMKDRGQPSYVYEVCIIDGSTIVVKGIGDTKNLWMDYRNYRCNARNCDQYLECPWSWGGGCDSFEPAYPEWANEKCKRCIHDCPTVNGCVFFEEKKDNKYRKVI
jgi:hypothetical protein